MSPCASMTAQTPRNLSSSCTQSSLCYSSFASHSQGLSALLTEINVALAQLHPNSWAFAILCNHLGHTPSVDVFLYFFEAKSPGKKLWMSINGVVGRVLLTLFQQSYKGFKGKFFKICCNKHDPTLLDGFPLY